MIEKEGVTNESFVCRQLSETDYLSVSQYKCISELIFDTDPYIYPALFGEGSAGITNACKLLPIVFESGEDCMFRKQNLFVLYKGDLRHFDITEGREL